MSDDAKTSAEGAAMQAPKPSPVIDVATAAGFPMGPEKGSDRFGAMVHPLSDALGAKGLGAMYMVVEPGKRAFPFHNHHGNEEMFVILEGEGVFRLGDAEHPVRAGCVCLAPAGGPETAHQLINTGAAPLKYLGISTRQDPDVVEYPDSGKAGALAIGEGRTFFTAKVKLIARADDNLDYWDGEDI